MSGNPRDDQKVAQSKSVPEATPAKACPLCGKSHREGLCPLAALLANPVSVAILS
jgi:hypothetical protein